jgi:hypothetical protein
MLHRSKLPQWPIQQHCRRIIKLRILLLLTRLRRIPHPNHKLHHSTVSPLLSISPGSGMQTYLPPLPKVPLLQHPPMVPLQHPPALSDRSWSLILKTSAKRPNQHLLMVKRSVIQHLLMIKRSAIQHLLMVKRSAMQHLLMIKRSAIQHLLMVKRSAEKI